MRFPQLSTAISVLINLGWFLICALRAEPETAGMDAVMTAADDGVRKSIGARNKATDMLTAARAYRAVCRRQAGRWLLRVSLDLNRSFDNKKQALGYVRILPKPPSALLRLGIADRMAAFEAVLRALKDPQTPKELAALATEGAKRIDALRGADQGVTAAEIELSKTVHGIAVAREAWFAAYRAAYGALLAKYPLDKDTVESFFDEPPVPPKKVTTDAVVVPAAMKATDQAEESEETEKKG